MEYSPLPKLCLNLLSELPTLTLRYSVGFPIHWGLPQLLRSFFGLTSPPWAGVLVPKTQIFFLQHLPISLVFAYGIDGQDVLILSDLLRVILGCVHQKKEYFVRLVVVVLESFRCAQTKIRLHSSPHSQFISTPPCRVGVSLLAV
jgi:hypothetical protein